MGQSHVCFKISHILKWILNQHRVDKDNYSGFPVFQPGVQGISLDQISILGRGAWDENLVVRSADVTESLILIVSISDQPALMLFIPMWIIMVLMLE